jgi:hypothetical protein
MGEAILQRAASSDSPIHDLLENLLKLPWKTNGTIDSYSTLLHSDLRG